MTDVASTQYQGGSHADGKRHGVSSECGDRAGRVSGVRDERPGRDRTLIAADFHFTSPLDNRIDRATYFQRCWPNSEALEKFEFIHVVTDGDRVFVTYEARNRDGHRFRNTEIVTIRDRHIVDVEVYFGWPLPHKAPQGGFVDASGS